MRLDGVYVDPLDYLAPMDVSALIRLAPVGAATARHRRRAAGAVGPLTFRMTRPWTPLVPSHLVRPRRRARFLASALAAGLTIAIALPVAASSVVVWSGFQGDPSHSGFAADGPAPPYAEAWTSPAELGGASAQFGLSQPVVVDDTVVTVGTEAIVGVDLATGDQVWTVARDAGPAVAPAAMTVGDTVAIAYTEGFGPHPPGSRASASASASTTASVSPSAGASSASGEPDGMPVDSHLAAIDFATQERLWRPVALDAVSFTGVTAADGVAYAATEAGSVYAVDLRTGHTAWTADAGEAVDTPLIVTDGLVIAVTRATSDEPSSVVALAVSDGSETWRWKSDTPVYRLSAASADDAHVYVGLSDQNGTLRALDLGTGSLAWTARTERRRQPRVGAGGHRRRRLRARLPRAAVPVRSGDGYP